MIRLAANLSMLFNEHAFLDRFAAAAESGFKGVEYLFPYAFAARDVQHALKDAQLEQVLFNMPPGDWDAGERGLASLPGREAEFRDSVTAALSYAEALGCPRVHAMAGLLPDNADAATQAEHHATYIRNLRFAANEAAKVGRDILIEPINTRDMPGFFLSRQAHHGGTGRGRCQESQAAVRPLPLPDHGRRPDSPSRTPVQRHWPCPDCRGA